MGNSLTLLSLGREVLTRATKSSLLALPCSLNGPSLLGMVRLRKSSSQRAWLISFYSFCANLDDVQPTGASSRLLLYSWVLTLC